MFIAIVAAHYFQFQREGSEDGSGDEDAGFFGLVLSIIRNNLKTDDDEDEEDEGAGGKAAKKKPQVGLLRRISNELISYFKKIDVLAGAPDEEDADERVERHEETERHRRAI